jgi:hypothetical protein
MQFSQKNEMNKFNSFYICLMFHIYFKYNLVRIFNRPKIISENIEKVKLFDVQFIPKSFLKNKYFLQHHHFTIGISNVHEISTLNHSTEYFAFSTYLF